MPYADPEKSKECKHKYYESVKNSEEYKNRVKGHVKKWRQTHPEDFRKSCSISQWRQRGLIESDIYNYDTLYDFYMITTHCELCDIELSTEKKRSSTTKCMDHDHKTGLFRKVLCHNCNSGLNK
jgi:hypothetical protein